jgi:hypothetical protein
MHSPELKLVQSNPLPFEDNTKNSADYSHHGMNVEQNCNAGIPIEK